MTYHPIVRRIKNLITDRGFWFETFEHEPVVTSAEAAKLRHGYTLQQGAKAIMVKIEKRDKTEEFVLLVIPAHLRISSKKVKDVLVCRSFRFATEEELSQVTGGIQRGGVPPLGDLFSIRTVVDERLYDNEKIVFNAGDRSFSVAMQSADYKNIVNQPSYSITEE